MAASIESQGDQTATIDTEHLLHTVASADGSYQLQVDSVNMQHGDVVILRAKQPVRAPGGTTRTVFEGTYAHAQTVPIIVSVPVTSAIEVEFSLEQTDGTGRVFPWNVTRLG